MRAAFQSRYKKLLNYHKEKEKQMDLDEEFQPLLAKRANAVSSVPSDTDSMEFGMDYETVTLCEVLELNVKAMAALGPYKRTKVLEEAKRNVKKWPFLNDVQRVRVNCALVDLQYTKARKRSDKPLNQLLLANHAEGKAADEQELEPEGRYFPVFATGQNGTLNISYKWMSAENEFPSSPVFSAHQFSDHDWMSDKETAPHELDKDKGKYSDMKTYPSIKTDHHRSQEDDDSINSFDLDDENFQCEIAEAKTRKVYRREGIKQITTPPRIDVSNQPARVIDNNAKHYKLGESERKMIGDVTGNVYLPKDTRRVKLPPRIRVPPRISLGYHHTRDDHKCVRSCSSCWSKGGLESKAAEADTGKGDVMKLSLPPRINTSGHTTQDNDKSDESNLFKRDLRLETAAAVIKKVCHPQDIKRSDGYRNQSKRLDSQLPVYPYFLPTNQVMFFPAPSGHGYDLKNCQMTVHGVDINALIDETMEEREVKKGRDGTMIADWEMVLEFKEDGTNNCPFLESNAFDEWEAVARSQRDKFRFGSLVL